ncbi:MAG: hypothetical protein R3320_06080 [Nitriliruptorales bacterium]|nr:hypothetical protein [Nitriliruptorales bacterium]
MPRDEVQAAYFALLRAREEVEALRRYEEYLRVERQRLARVTAEREALADTIDRKLRRGLRHTDNALDKAVELRRRVIDDELRRLPDRLEAAERYVEEAEEEHRTLKRSA